LSSGLGNLMIKEIKEMLRDPKILVGIVLMPLLMFPIMGSAIGISQTAVEESIKESLKSASIAVLDLDGGLAAKSLIGFLAESNITLLEINASNEEEALKRLQETNATVLLVIPPNFSYNMTNGLKGNLKIYTVFKSMSVTEAGKASAAGAPVTLYESAMVFHMVQQAFPGRDPKTVLDPVGLSYYIVFKGKFIKAPPEALLSGIIMSQSLGFPMVIMLMLITAMQIAATSIAIEKEEKTLETLLTLPIGRLSVLTGKLAGSIVVAGAGAIAALVGVNYYTSSIFSGVASAGTPPIDLEALGLVPSPLAYLLLGVTLFVTIVSALALAICIAVFSENVRSAQTLVSYLILPIVIPSIFLMLADINILPIAVQMVLYAIPYTHSIIAAQAAFTGDYLTMLKSIAYISLFTVAVLYVAAKIFTTERVVTARISLKRLKLKKW